MTINEKIFAGLDTPPGHYYTVEKIDERGYDYRFSLMKKGLFYGKKVNDFEVRMRDHDTPQDMVQYACRVLFNAYEHDRDYVDPQDEFDNYFGTK